MRYFVVHYQGTSGLVEVLIKGMLKDAALLAGKVNGRVLGYVDDNPDLHEIARTVEKELCWAGRKQ